MPSKSKSLKSKNVVRKTQNKGQKKGKMSSKTQNMKKSRAMKNLRKTQKRGSVLRKQKSMKKIKREQRRRLKKTMKKGGASLDATYKRGIGSERTLELFKKMSNEYDRVLGKIISGEPIYMLYDDTNYNLIDDSIAAKLIDDVETRSTRFVIEDSEDATDDSTEVIVFHYGREIPNIRDMDVILGIVNDSPYKPTKNYNRLEPFRLNLRSSGTGPRLPYENLCDTFGGDSEVQGLIKRLTDTESQIRDSIQDRNRKLIGQAGHSGDDGGFPVAADGAIGILQAMMNEPRDPVDNQTHVIHMKVIDGGRRGYILKLTQKEGVPRQELVLSNMLCAILPRYLNVNSLNIGIVSREETDTFFIDEGSHLIACVNSVLPIVQRVMPSIVESFQTLLNVKDENAETGYAALSHAKITKKHIQTLIEEIIDSVDLSDIIRRFIVLIPDEEVMKESIERRGGLIKRALTESIAHACTVHMSGQIDLHELMFSIRSNLQTMEEKVSGTLTYMKDKIKRNMAYVSHILGTSIVNSPRAGLENFVDLTMYVQNQIGKTITTMSRGTERLIIELSQTQVIDNLTNALLQNRKIFSRVETPIPVVLEERINELIQTSIDEDDVSKLIMLSRMLNNTCSFEARQAQAAQMAHEDRISGRDPDELQRTKSSTTFTKEHSFFGPLETPSKHKSGTSSQRSIEWYDTETNVNNNNEYVNNGNENNENNRNGNNGNGHGEPKKGTPFLKMNFSAHDDPRVDPNYEPPRMQAQEAQAEVEMNNNVAPHQQTEAQTLPTTGPMQAEEEEEAPELLRLGSEVSSNSSGSGSSKRPRDNGTIPQHERRVSRRRRQKSQSSAANKNNKGNPDVEM